MIVSKIPRGRMLELEEAAVDDLLARDAENSFTTGAVFDLSGGRATYSLFDQRKAESRAGATRALRWRRSMPACGTVGGRAMKLYYAPGACSLAPHIALEEVGERYELARVDLAANQQNSPEYLRLNPKARVPVLTDGDWV